MRTLFYLPASAARFTPKKSEAGFTGLFYNATILNPEKSAGRRRVPYALRSEL